MLSQRELEVTSLQKIYFLVSSLLSGDVDCYKTSRDMHVSGCTHIPHTYGHIKLEVQMDVV